MPAPAPIAFSFGETLVDFFEDHRAIGGGSLNVAWYLGTLGIPTAIVSAVGRDELGAEIREFLAAAGVDTSWIIERPEPTGTVDVRIVGGEPEFRINDSAWDHIDLARIPDPVPELVYFGTVAQRREANRGALGRLLALGPRHRFYDVNLREGYYTDGLLEPLLQETTILKLTDEEFEIVAGLAGVGTVPDLMDSCGLEMVALTKGERGADLYAGARCTPTRVSRSRSPTSSAPGTPSAACWRPASCSGRRRSAASRRPASPGPTSSGTRPPRSPRARRSRPCWACARN